MTKETNNKAIEEFMKAILCLKTEEECHRFFEDICTIKEVSAIAQRFAVARMLREERTYIDIAKETGASTATISRVNRSLNSGNDSYDMLFARMDEEKQGV